MRGQIIFLVVLIILSSSCYAETIGVSPGVVNFWNVLKGGYAEHGVTVSTSSQNNLSVEYKVYGEAADWVTVEAEPNFYVSRDSPAIFKIIVQPPENVQNGQYEARVNLLTSSLGEGTGFGSVVRAAVTMIINVDITGEQIIACRAAGISIADAEVGYPLEVSYSIYNDGNVVLSPVVEVDVWDQGELDLLDSHIFRTQSILPTSQGSTVKSLPNPLEIGQYWADVSIPECLDHPVKMTFDVVEPGSISDKGSLIKVSNSPWWKVGDTIPITAVFKNDGSRKVNAQFRGNVLLGGKIVEILESRELEVLPSETMDFLLYFTPGKVGKYQVVGKVYYNKKVTFEKGSIINVNPGEPVIITFADLYPILILFIIVSVIVLLILIIKREKKKQKILNNRRKIYK